ncbi:MAG: hypothetical protein MZV70_06640 [Desulfobacterales bacterium]|nr:hypothetical protein [Desulfobacterales bacterium]
MKRSRIVVAESDRSGHVPSLLLSETAEAASRIGRRQVLRQQPVLPAQRAGPFAGSRSPADEPRRSRRPAPTAPSPMGRWGGMLGGMLMGGLIGSLLFGGGHAWGGPGLIDIALIGGGLFLLFRFLRSRREAPPRPPAAGRLCRSTAAPPRGGGRPGYDPARPHAPADRPGA